MKRADLQKNVYASSQIYSKEFVYEKIPGSVVRAKLSQA
jgi:hypothetical protein